MKFPGPNVVAWLIRLFRLVAVPALAVLVRAASAGGGDERAVLLALIDRPRVSPAVEMTARERIDGFQVEHFSFSTEAATRLDAVLYAPGAAGDRPRAAVVLLHSTGQGKEAMLPLARELAGRGFAAVAMDARGYGRNAGPEGGRATYMAALVRAFQDGGGRPFLIDPAWDTMRLIDCLVARDDVDPGRIGLMGMSKGGMEAVLVAALDPRVRAVVPLIGVQSFRYALEHDRWQARAGALQPAVDRTAALAGAGKVDAAFMRTFFDRVAPGLTGRFDTPAMLPLIAPRALLVVNGETDRRNPLPGVSLCVEAARAAYARAGAGGEFEFLLQPGTGHAVTPAARERAVAWLVEKLTPR